MKFSSKTCWAAQPFQFYNLSFVNFCVFCCTRDCHVKIRILNENWIFHSFTTTIWCLYSSVNFEKMNSGSGSRTSRNCQTNIWGHWREKYEEDDILELFNVLTVGLIFFNSSKNSTICFAKKWSIKFSKNLKIFRKAKKFVKVCLHSTFNLTIFWKQI